MIHVTHKELQELINLEVSKAVKEYREVSLSCSTLLSKLETKIKSMEKEIEKKDGIIADLKDGLQRIILTKQVAIALQVPGENLWSISASSMISIAKRTMKKVEDKE